MHRRTLLALAAMVPAGTSAQPGTGTPDGIAETWRDPRRDGRALPVRLRLPRAPGSRPTVILSHGLGGSRDGLGYLGGALAAAGFVALHLQHPGSDLAVWRGVADPAAALAAAVTDVGNALARLRDGVFALDELERRNALPGGALEGRIDLARIAVAGHSFGAWTVLHLLGQRVVGGERGLALPDPRLKAGIALSPVPPRGIPPRLAYQRIAVPVLHLTGTRDSGALERVTPEDRQIPFHAITGPPQALAVLDGATHGAFADEPDAGPRWTDPTYHARAASLAVAFLRATLLDIPEAASFLAAGAPGLLGPEDRLTLKGFLPRG